MKFYNSKLFVNYILPTFLAAVLVFVSVIVLSGAQKAEASWYTASGIWSYRKPITIDHQKVATTSALTNFPMLFSVTDPELKFTEFGGKVASSTGLEMVFTSGDGATKLDYELEYYASTTGQVIAWVEVPTLSGVTDTDLYLYFGGNATAINTDQSNKTGVWDSNYMAVYHLGDGDSTAAGFYQDSTSNNLDATLTDGDGGVAQVAGKIGYALDFDGDNNDRLANTTNLSASFTDKYTACAWAKAETQKFYGGIISTSYYYTAGDSGFALQQYDTSGTLDAYVDTTNGGASSRIHTGPGASTLVGAGFQYLCAVYNGANLYAYRNATLDGNQSVTGNIDFGSTSYITIGNLHPVELFYPWDGPIDEARVSNIARGSDWITTEYRNQSSPSTFYSYGAVADYSRSASAINVKLTSSAAVGGAPGWYTAGGGAWTYRKKIVVDATKVATTSALTNFPLLVSVTDPDLRHTEHGGKVASSTGLELVFTSSNGTTKLDYELEHYASTTGETVAWVEIPSLSGTTDTTIYMYFGGNATAVNSDQSNKTGVWDSGFQGVWHFPNGTTLTALDSTSNANNGSISGASATAGQIDGGATSFSSLGITTNDDIVLSTDGTVCIWFNATSWAGDSHTLAKKDKNYALFGNFWHSNALTFAYWTTGSGFRYVHITNPSTGAWHHVCGVIVSDNASALYLDGALVDSTVTAPFGDGRVDTNILRFGGDTNFNGKLDEARVSNIARGSDWITTEYRNQSSPSKFYSYGGLENYNGRVNSAGAPAPVIKTRGGVKFR